MHWSLIVCLPFKLESNEKTVYMLDRSSFQEQRPKQEQMGSHKNRKFGGIEMRSAPSTQSLGVHSVQGNITFRKGRERVEICLLGLCAILLLVCTVLAALFAMELANGTEDGSHREGTSPPTSAPSPTTGTSDPRVCNTAECLEIAARFTQNVNDSVDPCEDFFRFACDGWIRDNPIPPSENEYITFIKKIQANNEKLRNLLQDATGDYNDPIMKAKRFYRSCMNEGEVERTTKQQLLELIRGLGSWALDNQTWNQSVWNWKRVLLAIQKTFLHSSPLFTIDVSTDPRYSEKHIVKVTSPKRV